VSREIKAHFGEARLLGEGKNGVCKKDVLFDHGDAAPQMRVRPIVFSAWRYLSQSIERGSVPSVSTPRFFKGLRPAWQDLDQI
jgi:hypothetical protein